MVTSVDKIDTSKVLNYGVIHNHSEGTSIEWFETAQEANGHVTELSTIAESGDSFMVVSLRHQWEVRQIG